MNKVWIVTDGEYSDYRIVAVFDSQESAKEFCNGIDAPEAVGPGGYGSSVGIEEYTIGPPELGELFQKVWQVYLNVESGELDYETWDFEVHPRNWSEGHLSSTTKGPCAAAQSTVSQEHALKVAAETRQAILRERASA